MHLRYIVKTWKLHGSNIMSKLNLSYNRLSIGSHNITQNAVVYCACLVDQICFVTNKVVAKAYQSIYTLLTGNFSIWLPDCLWNH